jgi:DNA polymerase III epsilon subunit-like protein
MAFTAADVQTTGLDARDRIVELAATVLRGHGEIPDQYVTVADPGPAGTSRAREICPLNDEQQCGRAEAPSTATTRPG